MLKIILCCLCMLLPLSAQGKLYKVVDAQGHITFTDKLPEVDAQEHKLGHVNMIGNDQFNLDTLQWIIPYQQENGAMIVNGTINGVAMRFVVDTGATFVAIPTALAQQAKLIPDDHMITAQTANGAVQVHTTTINTLHVANISRQQVAATIQDISTTEPKLGLLGMSFFDAYQMTIDQAKSEIVLKEK